MTRAEVFQFIARMPNAVASTRLLIMNFGVGVQSVVGDLIELKMIHEVNWYNGSAVQAFKVWKKWR